MPAILKFCVLIWFCSANALSVYTNLKNDVEFLNKLKSDHNGKLEKLNAENRSIISNYFRKLAEKYVSFVLYTSTNNPIGTAVKLNDNSLQSFQPNKTTKFVIHGWVSSGDDKMSISIKDAYLNHYDYNVVVVDWSKIADNVLYPLSANQTMYVGEYLGKFIKFIVDRYPQQLSRIHLIGHSLGAHIAGYAGKALKSENLEVFRVTGLDPANPLIENGLSKNDSKFVDVIHTSAGLLGKKQSLGHADFYPNGGTVPQPGCKLLILTCSHSKSWKYFLNSINNVSKYPAHNCASYDDFKRNICSETEYMGEATHSSANGNYYLQTTENDN